MNNLNKLRMLAGITVNANEEVELARQRTLAKQQDLTEGWWDVEVNQANTDGFRVQAKDRQEAKDKAEERLSHMRGGKGFIKSVKQDTSTNVTDSIDMRMNDQLEKMSDKEKEELFKKADRKARTKASNLSQLEKYILKTSKYKNHKKDDKKDDTNESLDVGSVVYTEFGGGTIVECLHDTDSYIIQYDDEDTQEFTFDELAESMHYYVNNIYQDFEDDKSKPINVADGSANDEQVWDEPMNPDNSKDESPCQLRTMDQQDNSPQDKSGDDLSNKMTCPPHIRALLTAEINQARKESEQLTVTNRDASVFYNDLANAFEDLSNLLAQNSIYGFKEAQTYAQTLMGPMLHKIPTEVWKYLTHGGQQRSLKSYMYEVK